MLCYSNEDICHYAALVGLDWNMPLKARLKNELPSALAVANFYES